MELLGQSTKEISDFCKSIGEPAYRGKQISDWIYKKCASSFDEMANLPQKLKDNLAGKSSITRSEIISRTNSNDNTTKLLLKLSDNETIECVLLPYSERISVCISTQVGCPVGCVFCATGSCGFVRNLTTDEIIDQILTLQRIANDRISHVVIMGMGEPLLNFDNTIKAIHLLNDEIGISMRRVTLSTVGITSQIQKLEKLDLAITLAISLHSPDDDIRAKLIPTSQNTPIKEIINAGKHYADATKRRISFEYMLIDGVNDSINCANKLAELLKGIMCHVNLIPYNTIEGKPFKKPSTAVIKQFRQVLEDSNIAVTQRFERGSSTSAACGQLKMKSNFSP